MADAYVYIDGYNLYHRACEGTQNTKWLDLFAFAQALVPNDTVLKVRYFTSKSRDLPNSPGAQQRQQVYWRALDTLGPTVERHLGQFKVRPGWRMLHKDHLGFRPKSQIAWVKLPEEKGSDVNLAAWLLLDGFKGLYDKAVVVSNDSDLKEPVRMAIHELKRTVVVANPDPNVKNDQLTGSQRRPVLLATLQGCQFPAQMQDAQGPFHKPPAW